MEAGIAWTVRDLPCVAVQKRYRCAEYTMNISFLDANLIYAASSGHNYTHNVKEKSLYGSKFFSFPPRYENNSWLLIPSVWDSVSVTALSHLKLTFFLNSYLYSFSSPFCLFACLPSFLSPCWLTRIALDSRVSGNKTLFTLFITSCNVFFPT